MTRDVARCGMWVDVLGPSPPTLTAQQAAQRPCSKSYSEPTRANSNGYDAGGETEATRDLDSGSPALEPH